MTIVYHAIQPPPFAHSKTCNICHQEKPLEQFQRDASKKDGYRNICKVCTSEKRKQQYTANPEQYRERSRINRANNPEYTREYNKAYRPKKNAKARERYASDLEYRAKTNQRVKLAHDARPDLRLERYNRYRRARLQQFSEYTMRRYALKRAATVEDVDYNRILERDGMWCYICEKPIMSHHKIEFDHVIPITRNGIHAESNIKVTHKVCNSRKNNKLIEEMTPFQRRGPKG